MSEKLEKLQEIEKSLQISIKETRENLEKDFSNLQTQHNHKISSLKNDLKDTVLKQKQELETTLENQRQENLKETEALLEKIKLKNSQKDTIVKKIAEFIAQKEVL